MKFSIRDLLLVTVIVALGVGWCVDRTRLATDNRRLEILDDTHREEIDQFRQWVETHRPNSSAPAPKLPKE